METGNNQQLEIVVRTMAVSPLTCSGEELYSVVAGGNRTHLRLSVSNPAITEDHLLILLRNNMITTDIIQLVCERYDWISSYKIQTAVVNCPKTPYTIAIRFLQLLFWQDLLKTAANLRVSPRIRRNAENYLLVKIAELTVGERMTLARTCPRQLIGYFRKEKDMKVVTSLLRNPHLVEEDVVLIINDEFTSQGVLESIGRDFKWSVRYQIRLALVRNSSTPLHLALSLISKLRHQDLLPLTKASDTPELIRRAADRILAGEY